MDELSVTKKHLKGRQPRPLALQTDKNRVRKSLQREQLARLVVAGKTQREAAEEMVQ